MKLIVEVEKNNGILVTTSNRVADGLGVEHKNLLLKIDEYIERFKALKSAKLSADFYIPCKYTDSKNREQRNYLITKKGIAQLISGYNASVPVAFALNVAYIQEFERMEEKLKNQTKSIANVPLMNLDDIRKEMSIDGIVLIYARDFYIALNIGRNFSDWLDARIGKYGFIENIDYFKCEEEKIGEYRQRDYWLTIGMARELSAIQNTLESRETRKYLVELEKIAKPVKVRFSERTVELAEKNHEILKEYLDKLQIIGTDMQQAAINIKTYAHESKARLSTNIITKLKTAVRNKQLN